ncbi:hypothetical protein [Flexithrix dorotheae]|uniref:hypothetical protein n=1 Tax=Flexithrix dorotheae TaxID=70993 RepID=UPI000368DA96|nr:hypothetical protein [Flexithrix dorotheae]
MNYFSNKSWDTYTFNQEEGKSSEPEFSEKEVNIFIKKTGLILAMVSSLIFITLVISW